MPRLGEGQPLLYRQPRFESFSSRSLSPVRISNGIPGSTYSQQAKYDMAAEKAVEVKNAAVTLYHPHIFTVAGEREGVPTENPIASRYARVAVGGKGEKEAWFEIIGTPSREKIEHLEFLTQHQLHIILGDTESLDSARVRAYAKSPREDVALVRLVSTDEVPLLTGKKRTTNPLEIEQATIQLSQQLLQKEYDPHHPEQFAPKVEDLQKAVSWEKDFQEVFRSENGVSFGTPLVINGTLDNGYSRTLYVYPTRSSDGKSSYIITNKTFPTDGTVEKEVIGRTDFLCGCQKFGDRSRGTHGCAHELLASLRGVVTPEEKAQPDQKDPTIIVAWGGIDANGNGSVMHSLKKDNMHALGLDPEPTSPESSRRHSALQELPYAEHRNFRQLAEVLWAGASLFGADKIRLQNGNQLKTRAMTREALNMFAVGGKDIQIAIEPHNDSVVPAEVRKEELREREPTRRHMKN